MYGYKKETDMTYEEAVERVREELKNEGFGVLTEIDVKATLKKKLGIEFDKYVILGACNPQFAHQALLAEHDIGLLLPCNVIVYEKEGKTTVAALLPTTTMAMIEDERLQSIAEQVEVKLKRVIDNIQ